MRLLLILIPMLALAAACASDAPDDTGTVRSDRAARDASVTQQQSFPAGVIDFGHRAGLPFTRNVVGDPDAPVLIVEYSDFQ